MPFPRFRFADKGVPSTGEIVLGMSPDSAAALVTQAMNELRMHPEPLPPWGIDGVFRMMLWMNISRSRWRRGLWALGELLSIGSPAAATHLDTYHRVEARFTTEPHGTRITVRAISPSGHEKYFRRRGRRHVERLLRRVQRLAR